MADVGARLLYPPVVVPTAAAAICVDKLYHPVVVEAGARIELETNAFHPSNEGVVA